MRTGGPRHHQPGDPEHDHRPAAFFRTGDLDVQSALGEPLRDANLVEMPVRVGSYRPLRILGEGGFGIVYLAEQESPRRTVALKLIRSPASFPFWMGIARSPAVSVPDRRWKVCSSVSDPLPTRQVPATRAGTR